MRHILIRFAIGAALGLSAAGTTLAQDFTIDWWTVDSGGAMLSTGDELELSGTIGQHDAGVLAGGDFELAGGFWPGLATQFTPACPGDLDGDLHVGLPDLAQLIGHYGTMSGATYEDGDLDFDGDVDLVDLSELLGHYGTICVSCPGDLDGDNIVGLADLAELIGHYGTASGASYEDGDLDFDGDVDLTDLAELIGLYGTVCE